MKISVLHVTFLGLLASSAALSAPSAQASDFRAAQQGPSYLVLAGAQQGAQDFINGVSQRGIGFLSNSEMSDAQREKEFRKLLTSSFDINTIARFSMGRHWRELSESQRNEYLGLFREMIVKVYSKRFNEYNGQQLRVTGSRVQDDGDVIVSSNLVSDGSPEVRVEWRVRQKGEGFKIVDVIIEGVSMALTQRSDFSSVIQRGGGDVNVLIAHLRK